MAGKDVEKLTMFSYQISKPVSKDHQDYQAPPSLSTPIKFEARIDKVDRKTYIDIKFLYDFQKIVQINNDLLLATCLGVKPYISLPKGKDISESIGHGTKIVLQVEENQAELLERKKLDENVKKHPQYMSYPIGLQVQKECENQFGYHEDIPAGAIAYVSLKIYRCWV